ncbi:MAG: peptidylprolyl isomerase [Candidatus Fermentibacteria bacterium]
MLFKILTLMATILIVSVSACGGEAEVANSDPVPDETGLTVEDPVVTEGPEMVYASHILIPYQGCQQAPADAMSMEDARVLLSSIADSISNGEVAFGEAAAKHSSCPSSAQGGSLGSFVRGQMVPEFDEVAFNLEPGEVSEVFATTYGFHIILRQETIQASHILLAYEGAERSAATRTKEEALEIIEGLQENISDGSLTFIDAAAGNSDCPSSSDGGDLGHFPRGVMTTAFEDAAFALEPGDISGIVETPFGYHLIMRTR